MIKIDIDKDRLESIKDKYCKHIVSKIKHWDDNSIYSYYHDNISRIIGASCSEFRGIIKEFNDIKSTEKEKDDFRLYMKVEYERLFRNKYEGYPLGYWLATELDIRVCPYCNRQYTFTVYKRGQNNGVRPQFDHFYPKKHYAYFALSFYNLIPICPTCNHAKGEKEIAINPYVEGFPKDYRFEINKPEECYFNNRKEWEILLPQKEEYNEQIKRLALDQLYTEHKDYVEEIVFKARAYNDGYYKELMQTFSGLGLSECEMKLMIFGNYINPQDYSKRVLSKLTADIYEQIIKK